MFIVRWLGEFDARKTITFCDPKQQKNDAQTENEEIKKEKKKYEDQDKTVCIAQNEMQAKEPRMCRHCNNSIDKLFVLGCGLVLLFFFSVHSANRVRRIEWKKVEKRDKRI